MTLSTVVNLRQISARHSKSASFNNLLAVLFGENVTWIWSKEKKRDKKFPTEDTIKAF